ncbi:recombinase family protein [Methyloceanibacter sp. wino2]|uniref:recombinase family protein n=1 Tax=Methyloceanibacter sp. wino2 TaxID=2170729 RepID=UPI001FE117F6|nr:recombinase family protein [Methyloceanibacter sp. wino2]
MLLYLEIKLQLCDYPIELKQVMSKQMKPAVAYLRTSSATNVGADKDSDKRQRAAIEAFAERAGFQIVDEYYDRAVSGADLVDQRPGFAEMLQRLASNGAKTIIVESPDRFARDLAVQLAGHDMLRDLGIAIIPASAPDFFTEDTPTAVLVRQVLGAIAQFEKASVVAKLAAARKRKRQSEGRCEGRKPLQETHPEVVALARKLRRKRPKAGRMSLRAISKELAACGYVNERGRPYAAKSVASMLA